MEAIQKRGKRKITLWKEFIMKRIIVILTMIILITPAVVHAGDSGWEFRFFGINPADFEGRKVLPIVIGGITSFAVHEAGHYLAGRSVGMDPSFDWDKKAVWADDYDDKSDDQKAFFSAGGFIAQALVGTVHDSTRFVVSPLTGELVPIDKMGEHMRVSLIDPRWKTQREAMLAKIKETTKASDDEISRNLALLAKTRPDIFDGGAEAMTSAIEKQIDLEKSTDRNQSQGMKRHRI